MYTVTPTEKDSSKSMVVQTKKDINPNKSTDWWNSYGKSELSDKLLATVGFLKQQNEYRYRQASLYSRLYGNMPLFGYAGTNFTKISAGQLPGDRPTMSVITSCVDTIVSRLGQSRPRPIFLTDNGNYKERNLAKQMNQFIAGELYQTKAYQQTELLLRDAAVLGTGCIKILEDQYGRVELERRLCTELLVDPNDSFYGKPRQLYEIKLVERSVLLENFPKYSDLIVKAEQAFPDQSSDSQYSVTDLIMVAEGWHLASGPNAKDGIHAIICSSGVIFDESFTKRTFPFCFLHYAPRMLGFWGQGLPERQFGTQIEINKLLMTISDSINLVGVPRVFLEEGSKVLKAAINNAIGAIVTYRGTKPIYEVAPCIAPEIYAQLQRLVMYAYEQEGVSQLSATSQKPAGLNSGEALRSYDDIQSDRFSALQKRYNDFYIDLAYQIIDKARDIAKRDGHYQTVFPNKDGTKKIDLPASKLLDDPFVIQCYDTSSLPRDPAGRLQKVVEMMQGGIISIPEGRRLLDFPDIDQMDKLANAGEERIMQILDRIVDTGKYTPPDPFMNPHQALELVIQYYNLYEQAKLEEEKAEMLRTFKVQCEDLIKAALPPPTPVPGGNELAPPNPALANPLPSPQSELLPTIPGVS